jgi:hypothetical protein
MTARLHPAGYVASVTRFSRPELWLRPRDGHVSVLDAIPAAFDRGASSYE